MDRLIIHIAVEERFSLRFPGLVVKHLVQALPSVQTLQCPTGRLEMKMYNESNQSQYSITIAL